MEHGDGPYSNHTPASVVTLDPRDSLYRLSAAMDNGTDPTVQQVRNTRNP